MNPRICLALRFHTNCYHSYRGDTNDEAGFGKDIRIIRSILDNLDRLEAEGVPVKGTWDIENYYSLEKILPAHAPDLIRRIRDRVAAGKDEVEHMSYNNGIVSAATPAEFRRITEQTLHNQAGSGLADIFAETAPILRPQECMYTPSFLKHYPQAGVGTISLYYSCHPFNGFSNFIPRLSITESCNPLFLRSDSMPQDAVMTLLPAYNHADIADRWMSLRRWIKHLRRQQLKMPEPADLLLVIDMDADDDFWCGIPMPVLPALFPSFDGLYRMVMNLHNLDYVDYVRPADYLKTHSPRGTVTLDQDTADGSFDGYSSWAEKLSNTRLWTKLQKSRIMADAAVSIQTGNTGETDALLQEAGDKRILCMSTTHFGLSSPVMNVDRLRQAFAMADEVLALSARALAAAAGKLPRSQEYRRYLHPRILDDASGGRTPDLITPLVIDPDSTTLAGTGQPLPGTAAAGNATVSPTAAGATRSVETVSHATADRTAGVSGADAAVRWFLPDHITRPVPSAPAGIPLESGADYIANGRLRVGFNPHEGITLTKDGEIINSAGYPRTSVRYNGRLRLPGPQTMSVCPGDERTPASLRLSGFLPLNGTARVEFSHTWFVFPHVPWFYVEVRVSYPQTEERAPNRERARRLRREWDPRWNEIMPFEIVPRLKGTGSAPLRVIKHNFFGDTGRYLLNYHEFSRNRELTSFNNHITNGWVAVGNGRDGLLVAQNCAYDNNFAFCPMRLKSRNGRQQIRLNPFGTYHGRQWHYAAKETGLGRMLSLGMSDHLDSCAPSYNGGSQHFLLMIAPFSGPEPDAADGQGATDRTDLPGGLAAADEPDLPGQSSMPGSREGQGRRRGAGKQDLPAQSSVPGSREGQGWYRSPVGADDPGRLNAAGGPGDPGGQGATDRTDLPGGLAAADGLATEALAFSRPVLII